MIIKKFFKFFKYYSKKQCIILILFCILSLNYFNIDMMILKASSDIEVIIYVNGCFCCSSNYVEDMMEMLKGINVTNIRIEYLNDSIKSQEILNQLKNNINLSEVMNSNIILCINKYFIFEGNTSKEIIKDFLLNYINSYQYMWVYYDNDKNIYIFNFIFRARVRKSLDFR